MSVSYSRIPTMGQRVRRFRELRGKTQQELELGIEAAFGHISRIESDKVNPSKETLTAIAKLLVLNNREYNYLMGITTEAASQDEIQPAIAEVESYFQKKGVIAYLLDERWRFIKLSDGFMHLLGYEPDSPRMKKIIGITTLHILLDPELEPVTHLDPAHFEELLRIHGAYYFAQTRHMIGDPSHTATAAAAKCHPQMAPIWDDICHTQAINFSPQESRTVYFKVNGLSVRTEFSRESLQINSRFEVVEYHPTSSMVKFLMKSGRC